MLSDGRTVLLQPTFQPTKDAYALKIDVSAQRDDGTTAAFGSTTTGVGTHACNRVQLSLASLALPDLAMPAYDQTPPQLDFSTVPDFAACTATTPDEDGDGRGDVCDVCAADADPAPTDSDSDGLPDACDPDSQRKNARVYFEPFNTKAPGWKGDAFTVDSSAAGISVTGGGLGQSAYAESGASATPLPAEVWLEAHLRPTAFPLSFDGGAEILLYTNVATAGYRCAMGIRSVGNPQLIVSQIGGSSVSANVTPADFVVGQDLVLRISKRGTTLHCELDRAGRDKPVAVELSTPVSNAPLFAGFGVMVEGYSNSGT